MATETPRPEMFVRVAEGVTICAKPEVWLRDGGSWEEAEQTACRTCGEPYGHHFQVRKMDHFVALLLGAVAFLRRGEDSNG